MSDFETGISSENLDNNQPSVEDESKENNIILPEGSYIENLWNLDHTKNPVEDDRKKKKQFEFQILKEDFKNFQEHEASKKSEVRGTWTDIYQLIGFYVVFQGVWFQGVTQLAALQRGCKFSIIPIILSVFVSLATIVGVYVKLSAVLVIQKSIFTDKLVTKVHESKISSFQKCGLDTTEKSIDRSVAILKNQYEEQLGSSNRYRVVVLGSLTIFSGLFSWLIYTIMCDKYY